MKPNKTVERIEHALWNAGRSFDPFVGKSDWQDGVMAEIRQIGPLQTKAPGKVHEPATGWSWAAAVAACLAIGIGWYTFNDLNADTVLAGLFLDDPAGWTVNIMLIEM